MVSSGSIEAACVSNIFCQRNKNDLDLFYYSSYIQYSVYFILCVLSSLTREVSTAGVQTKGSTFLLFSTSTQRVKKFQLPFFFFFTEEQQFLTCMLCIYMHTVSVTWCMHTFIALCNIIKFSFAQQSMTILRSHISHSQHRPFTLSFLCSPT